MWCHSCRLWSAVLDGAVHVVRASSESRNTMAVLYIFFLWSRRQEEHRTVLSVRKHYFMKRVEDRTFLVFPFLQNAVDFFFSFSRSTTCIFMTFFFSCVIYWLCTRVCDRRKDVERELFFLLLGSVLATNKIWTFYCTTVGNGGDSWLLPNSKLYLVLTKTHQTRKYLCHIQYSL